MNITCIYECTFNVFDKLLSIASNAVMCECDCLLPSVINCGINRESVMHAAQS